MGAKSLAMIAAAYAASLAAPCYSQEFRAPTTMFFMEVPLDARTPKAPALNFGLMLQGSRPYQSLRVDRRTFESFKLLGTLGGIEGTWLVAGAVGVVAVAAIAHKDKGTEQQIDAQKQQQLEACPVQCAPK